MKSTHGRSGLVAGGLGRAGRWIVRHPWVIIVTYGALVAAAAISSVLKLELRTDQNELVSTDLEQSRRFLDFIDEFGDLEYLYVVVRVGDNTERAVAAVDRIAAGLRPLTEHVEEVFERVPPEAFGDSVLLLPSVPEDKLRDLASALASHATQIGQVVTARGFADVCLLLARELAQVRQDQPNGDDELTRFGGQFVGAFLRELQVAADGGKPESLRESLESQVLKLGRPRERGYLFSTNNRIAIIQVMPRKDFRTVEVIREPLREIRAVLDQVRGEFPDLEIGLTGRPVLQADEMMTTNRDMLQGTLVALVAVLALFIAFFRRLRRPLLAGLTLIAALTLTFGVVTWTLGYLTLLSIVFAAMLVGLGIDFGIHFLARYQEELLRTDDIDQSVETTLRTTGVSILTGGVTTAGAFYTALFVHFRGLAELGFVAGTGVLICLVSMLTLLPALVAVTDHRLRLRRVLTPPKPIQIHFLGRVPSVSGFVIVLLTICTLVGLLFFRPVSYNYNILDLQARGLESVRYEHVILDESDVATWYAVYILDDLPAVDRLLEKLTPLKDGDVIAQVESIRDLVVADPAGRIAALAPAAAVVRSLPPPVPAAPLDPAALRESLGGLLDALDGLQSKAASAERPEAVRTLETWIAIVENLEERLTDSTVAARLAAYQTQWLGELQELRDALARIVAPAPINTDDLHRALRRRFISSTGRHLVYAYPAKDIWQEENIAEFVRVTAEVDPTVTGTPAQFYESANLMKEGFVRSAIYAVALVTLFLVINFRSWVAAALAMVPLFAGIVWLLLLMPILGMDFNLANFFGLPILIGCGVDGGVHMVHGFTERRSTRDLCRTVASAVTLSFITTMAGFGALCVAQHRGVASLGQLMALGCLTVLVATVIFLPALLELSHRLSRRRAVKRGRARSRAGAG